ncbi:MAG: gephyrin-like molybdotransferase Glp [Candidatus Bathyarchaeia archaeon]|jgi:putative molybdopterin biosynthesis protein
MIRKLLTFEEAKRTIEANFKPQFLGEEEAVLLEAANRVLAADVASPIDIPSFSSSKFNGYAIKAQDTVAADEDAPVELKVVGCVGVGEECKVQLQNGEAVEVSADAVLPEGADAVIALEDAAQEDDALKVFSPLAVGEGVYQRGCDIKAGSVVLAKGQVLGSSEIGVLAALGLKQVKVQKIPIIAVFSVGSEVNELSKPPAHGKTYDLNGYSLSTAVMECGAKPVYFGVVDNDKSELTRVLKAALASSDLVIASGGESIVAEVLDGMDKQGLVVNGVALKPGKTFAAAFIEGKPVFCLPSNPSAALLMYQLFARTLVQRLGGRPASGLKTIAAIAGAKMFSAKGSRTFQLVKLEFDEKCRLIAQPVTASGVSALVEADGFVEIAENEQFVEVDSEVAVLLFRGLAGKA